MTAVLISVDELADAVAGGNGPVLLDVRWALGDPDGHAHYLDAHIPGAVFVDLEMELADPPSPEAGRHPLPSSADLQVSARRWGIRQGASVVVYDSTGGMAAARAWWLLRWGGLTDVRILDGGFPAWVATGHPLQSGTQPPPAEGDVELSGGAMPVIDIDAAAQWTGVLLDARAGERFRGEQEPIDPRAGHIPGAVSMPTAGNLDSSGRFAKVDVLRDRFGALDGPVAVYCGSGVTAAHEIAALAVIGVDAALYAGSWSQWSNDPNREVATDA